MGAGVTAAVAATGLGPITGLGLAVELGPTAGRGVHAAVSVSAAAQDEKEVRPREWRRRGVRQLARAAGTVRFIREDDTRSTDPDTTLDGCRRLCSAYVPMNHDKAGAVGQDERLRCLSVELSSKGITELDGARAVVFLPRDEIVRAELRRGISGERPIAQFVFAALFSALSVASLLIVRAWWLHGGLISVKVVPGMALAPLGPWLIWSTLRPAYYLHVRTQDDVRKIVFRGRAHRADIEACLRRANMLFGFEITSRLPGFDLVGAPYR